MASRELSSELGAMVAIEGALAPLESEVQARVLRWACERFGVAAAAKVGSVSTKAVGTVVVEPMGNNSEASSLAEFYDSAAPSTDADKVLVAAYWFQFREGHPEIEARHINTELKHLGYGVGNITRAFENLKATRPALIVQTRKDGSTRQAQKKFKVTHEGRKAVDRMVTATTGE